MTIKSAPYYWAECDRCGDRAEFGDFSALSAVEDVEEQLGWGDWLSLPSRDGLGRHYCRRCTVWSDDEDTMVPRTEGENPNA